MRGTVPIVPPCSGTPRSGPLTDDPSGTQDTVPLPRVVPPSHDPRGDDPDLTLGAFGALWRGLRATMLPVGRAAPIAPAVSA